ncbi:hypothetical protein [Xanthomonas cucurbitae]|uniref:Lytic transglycosylase n=1 Tax=Xanthomonas cucurbitae TaxID=56453 RepID=A0ABY7YC89_9XANT|nr:hypothetical protein [Xanthomonas cucurbitae]WDM67617.1 hypothetical protein K6981_19620 [Xanthomonas cucurbitae]WDM71493.1 hypothetical protein K6978_19585 [Xanthomonas cucurbitae]
MEIFFCKSWFRAKKCPTEMWSEDQAKIAHAQGAAYTVIVGDIDNPYCFLDVTEKSVGVSFLDRNLRESLLYDFQEIESGKLFLTMATYREFEGDTDRVVSGTSYVFFQDGMVATKREFFNPHKIETARSSADVAGNYSPRPEFGQYSDLIRVERNQ